MNKTKPKISVITVTYNASAYLAQCVDSVLGQSLNEIELICLENGSQDQCLSMLEQYAEKDQRVRVYDMKKTDIFHIVEDFPESTCYDCVLNFAFSLAQGEYILILDNDDWLEEGALALLYEKASGEQLDLLCFGTQMEFESENFAEKYQHYIQEYQRPLGSDGMMTGIVYTKMR